MRRVLVSGLGLLIGGAAVGAVAFPEQVAHAAQAIMQVRVMNTAAEAVPVRQQGTANVNVTNGSLSVSELAPVTGGGGGALVTEGTPETLSTPVTATAVIIGFRNDAFALRLHYQGEVVASFPNAMVTDNLTLALTRPVRFDRLVCVGPATNSECLVGWVGAEP